MMINTDININNTPDCTRSLTPTVFVFLQALITQIATGSVPMAIVRKTGAEIYFNDHMVVNQEKADEILIDRGDLSREVNIEQIPVFQKAIIESANKVNVPVHVATNLLESMIKNTYPTRAELNDIMKTLENGANGLVLAAETAIGSHPIASICMIKKIINSWAKTQNKKYLLKELINEESHYLSLNEPHGGKLINRMVKTKYEDKNLSFLY